jgi:hypothetical protein
MIQKGGRKRLFTWRNFFLGIRMPLKKCHSRRRRKCHCEKHMGEEVWVLIKNSYFSAD